MGNLNEYIYVITIILGRRRTQARAAQLRADGINLALAPSNTRHIAPGATRVEHVSPRTFPEIVFGRRRQTQHS